MSSRACPGRLLALTMLLVAFLMALPAAVSAAEREKSADLERAIRLAQGQPVYDNAVCEKTCHSNIAKTKNYDGTIIFSHGYHKVVACSSCHPRFPHRLDQKVERPSMKVCFNCHDLRHGPSGILAEGACAGCHKVPVDQLRPKSHTWDWAEKPHVAPSKVDFNTQCAMCHKPASCIECHNEKGVVWAPEQWEYNAGEGCLACHGGNALTVRAANVEVAGLKRSAHPDVSCQQCHPDYRYDDKNADTEMWRVNAGIACKRCHANSDEARLSAPVDKYDTSVHGKAIAEKNFDSATCASCHGGHFIYRTDTESARRDLYFSAQTTCGGCHDKEYASYNDPYHGEAYKSGVEDAPACWTCHNSHAVGSLDSPSSAMYEANRPETCGKTGCHAGADEGFGADNGSLIHSGSTTSLLRMVKTGDVSD